MAEQFDVIIIGGGPGGYSAALRAAQLELKVALIEKDVVGGLCLHDACIPSKTLLAAASIPDAAKKGAQIGIRMEQPTVDWAAVQNHKSSLVSKLEKGLIGLIKSREIEVVTGLGRISGAKVISVAAANGERELSAPDIILALGTSPIGGNVDLGPGIGLNTSEALSLKEIPTSLAVVGSDAWACEFAALYNSFGAQVWLASDPDDFLPGVEPDIATLYKRSLGKTGVNLVDLTSDISRSGTGAALNVDDGKGGTQLVEVDKVIFSLGRRASLDSLGVEDLEAPIEMGDDGFVEVNSSMMTSSPGIYAVGDLTGEPMLASAAFAEGMVAAEAIAGLQSRPLNDRYIPRLVYGEIELLAVGLTEEQARAEGIEVRSARYPLQGSARALMLQESSGAVKVVIDDAGTVIGLHAVGPRVTELAGEAQLLTNWEASVEDLEGLLHPHPTVSEGIVEAAFSAAGRPFHMMQVNKGKGGRVAP